MNAALTIPQGGGGGEGEEHLNLWAPFTGYLLAYISELKSPSSRAWILLAEKAKKIANENVKGNRDDNYMMGGSHPSSRGKAYSKFLGGGITSSVPINFLETKG